MAGWFGTPCILIQHFIFHLVEILQMEVKKKNLLYLLCIVSTVTHIHQTH